MSQNLPFTKCLHPVLVKHNRQEQLVKCGKCEACENSKRSELRAKVQFEETHAKHTFFITLTYDDTHLPIFRYVVDSTPSEDDFATKGFYYERRESPKVQVYAPSGKPIAGEFVTYSNLRLASVRNAFVPLQPRVAEDNFNSRFNDWAYCEDTELYSRCMSFSNDPSIPLLLQDYHARLQKNAGYCKSHGIRNKSLSWYDTVNNAYECVPFLYYPDIQRFIKRLRKSLTSKFKQTNEDISLRYYAIGEYGTSSFRPHWHLLLFVNSDSIAEFLCDSFTEDRVLSTKDRTIYSNSFISSLWRYGACTIDKTDGKASGYLSNYVVGASSLPQIFNKFMPQKAFHSVRFGVPFSEDQVSEMLHTRQYLKFSQISYVDDYSTLQHRPLWRSYYNLFFPQFTGVNVLSDSEKYRVLTIYPKLASYFFEDSVKDLAKSIWCKCILPYKRGKKLSEIETQIAKFFDWFEFTPATTLSLAPLTSVLYASKRFLRISYSLGFTPYEYFKVWRDFVSWRDMRQLKQHYHDCAVNEIYKNDYYNIYGSSKIDLDYMAASPLYKVFRIDALRQNQKLVKHKTFVEQLKQI